MELRRRRYCIFPTLSPPNQGAAYIFNCFRRFGGHFLLKLRDNRCSVGFNLWQLIHHATDLYCSAHQIAAMRWFEAKAAFHRC